MAFSEVHRVNKPKLYSGCGDGVCLTPRPERPRRVPIPSSRRFATRLPAAKDTDVKDKLERAIIELETPTKRRKPRRKSMTVAEITPTKRKPKSNISDGFMTDVEDATIKQSGLKATSRRWRLDAGHRVYNLLLLNAWRRRRTEVAMLSESLKQIQAQNSQLLIQADVLQKLRESECKRRDQAVTENGTLKEEIYALIKTNNLLTEDKKFLEDQLTARGEENSTLQIELQNVKNDVANLRNNIKCSEDAISKERSKILNLKEDIRILTEKVAESERDAYINQEMSKKLREKIMILERNLYEYKAKNTQQSEEISILQSEIMQEQEEKGELNSTIEILISEKENLQFEMDKYKKKIQENEDEKEKLKLQIQTVKMQVEILKMSLQREKNKPWWKSTRDVFRCPLELFKTAAIIMLPALPRPQNDSKSADLLN